MSGWIDTKEESFLKHPLTRLVVTFLLTTVAGTYLTVQWKAKDWENQQRYLHEQERLKEAYKVLDSTVESVSRTLTAADDLATVAIWGWDPKERETQLSGRITFWQEESREWRSSSRVVLSKLRIHFGQDAARSYQTIINKRRQLGVDVRGLLEKLQAEDWEEHREAIQEQGRVINAKINKIDEELSALTGALHEALSKRSDSDGSLAASLSAPARESPPPAAAPPEPLDATPFFAALSVRSAEASAAWYGKVFGFEVVRKMEPPGRGVRVFLLRNPGALLELVESEEARGPAELEPPLERRHLLHGVFKVGFLVEDLDVALRRLKDLEVPLRGEVFTEPDGSFRSLQVEDPDGNVIQVFERLEVE